MDKREILRRLQNILGEDYATDSPAVLAGYGYRNPAQPQAEMTDFAVIPGSTGDVRGVIGIANEYKLPVIPAGVGMISYDGSRGGILMDTYSRLDRIPEINAEDGYAVIEPGVTFGTLANALREHNCHFPFGSYPGSAAIVPHMMRNCGAWTMYCQAGGNEVIALEVVLGSGEVVRTGYAGLEEPDWSSPSPHGIMPDLKDVFIHTQGIMGVVTRASVRIFDRNQIRADPIGAFDSAWDAYRWVKKLSRAYLIEHGTIVNYNYIRWYRNHYESKDLREVNRRMSELVRRQQLASERPADGMPYTLVPLMMSGYDGELQAREKFAARAAGECGGRVLSASEEQEFIGETYLSEGYRPSFLEHLPMDPNVRMKFSLEMQGYISNVFVGPASELARAEPDMLKALDDGGIRWAEYYFNPADQARNGYLRMGTVTDPLLPEDERVAYQEKITAAMAEQRKRIPAKYNLHFFDSWQAYYGGDRIIPGSLELLRAIKRYCDPNGIMNPPLSGPLMGGGK